MQLAPFADRLSFGRVLRAVEAAVLRHDPDFARVREARSTEKRGVWLDVCLDGTTQITAVTGTPEARAFDHIDPYLPPDRGGPPGQTRSDNLVRLCRFHHRVKTHCESAFGRPRKVARRSGAVQSSAEFRTDSQRVARAGDSRHRFWAFAAPLVPVAVH